MNAGVSPFTTGFDSWAIEENTVLAQSVADRLRNRSPSTASVSTRDQTADGSASPSSELKGFAIAGDNHKWLWADAKIDGDGVLVWNNALEHPVAVRYDWSDFPLGNLYDESGLPAALFRTDAWPLGR